MLGTWGEGDVDEEIIPSNCVRKCHEEIYFFENY